MQHTNGTEVGRRYLLVSRIASGGMGEVWRGVDTVLDRPVAIKLLKTGLTDEPEFLARFRVEARNAARLNHGNIAQVYDYGEDGDTAYLVMELIEGEPLSKVIAERAPMPEADAVHLLVQAANALHAAHTKGIVHRDVKPANIVVDDEAVAKLTDFGIARAFDASSMTRSGDVMGTPQYLAPEAALGKEATAESDIYSLGVVAFQMLVGRLPFHADTAMGFALAHVQEAAPPLPNSVSAPLRAVVGSALAKNPDDRPQGAVEFARELQTAVDLASFATAKITMPRTLKLQPHPVQTATEHGVDLNQDEASRKSPKSSSHDFERSTWVDEPTSRDNNSGGRNTLASEEALAALREKLLNDDKKKKTDPEQAVRAQSMVDQLEKAVADVEAQFAKAREEGNVKRAKELNESLRARRAWLEQARDQLQ